MTAAASPTARRASQHFFFFSKQEKRRYFFHPAFFADCYQPCHITLNQRSQAETCRTMEEGSEVRPYPHALRFIQPATHHRMDGMPRQPATFLPSNISHPFCFSTNTRTWLRSVCISSFIGSVATRLGRRVAAAASERPRPAAERWERHGSVGLSV